MHDPLKPKKARPYFSATLQGLRELPTQLRSLKKAKELKLEAHITSGLPTRMRDIAALELAHRIALAAANYPVSFAEFYRAKMGADLFEGKE